MGTSDHAHPGASDHATPPSSDLGESVARRLWTAAADGVALLVGPAVSAVLEHPVVRAGWQALLHRLSLASLDDVAELRARLDALEALLRELPAAEGGRPGRAGLPPRMLESLGRARAALGDLGGTTGRRGRASGPARGNDADDE